MPHGLTISSGASVLLYYGIFTKFFVHIHRIYGTTMLRNWLLANRKSSRSCWLEFCEGLWNVSPEKREMLRAGSRVPLINLIELWAGTESC